MKIHTTIGVYEDHSRRVNGVEAADLTAHIEYNKIYRWGRALFVDGKCVFQGYLSKEECDAIEKDLAENPVVMTKCTAPYH